jgi:hypothetical protein
MTTSAHTHTTMAARLGHYLAGLPHAGFDWERRNCCHLAAGWVELIEGRHLMPAMPSGANALVARRMLKGRGGNLAAAVTRALGRTPIVPAQARVGDLVLVPTPLDEGSGTGQALGICAGRTAVCLGVDGAQLYLPTLGAVAAWRVEQGGAA